jgi:hypothetical protein
VISLGHVRSGAASQVSGSETRILIKSNSVNMAKPAQWGAGVPLHNYVNR